MSLPPFLCQLEILQRSSKTSDCIDGLQDPRQYSTSFTIRGSDFSKVPGILSDVLNYLEAAPGVDKLLPKSAKLQSLGGSSVTIGVTVSLDNLHCFCPPILEG